MLEMRGCETRVRETRKRDNENEREGEREGRDDGGSKVKMGGNDLGMCSRNRVSHIGLLCLARALRERRIEQ